MKESIVLIANPVARRASEEKIQEAAGLLSSAGYNVEVFLTGKKGDAEARAREAAKEGISLVVAAGGDGTFNEVINGIAYTGTRMAILPLGTTNVLAKELGVPEDMKGAVRAAMHGNTCLVSLGRITLERPAPAMRYFCLMAGIGFDGAAVYGVDTGVKRYSGKAAYILSGLRTLLRYSPDALTFSANGVACTGHSAVIGKAARYGGNFKVTPDASLTRPELYACIMQGGRRSDILRYAWGIATGRHTTFHDIQYLKTSFMEVKGDAHIQIDGDYLGRTPAVITVMPDALRLVS